MFTLLSTAVVFFATAFLSFNNLVKAQLLSNAGTIEIHTSIEG
jgi:cell division protein FtsX